MKTKKGIGDDFYYLFLFFSFLIVSFIFVYKLMDSDERNPNNLMDSIKNDCRLAIKISVPSPYNQYYLDYGNIPLRMNESEYRHFPPNELIKVCKGRDSESGECLEEIFAFEAKC